MALPVVKHFYKGTSSAIWMNGFTIGIIYEGNFYGAKFDGEDDTRVFKLHMLQFHLGFLSLTLAWSIEHPDKEWQNYE